jgi:hypothetical protein
MNSIQYQLHLLFLTTQGNIYLLSSIKSNSITSHIFNFLLHFIKIHPLLTSHIVKSNQFKSPFFIAVQAYLLSFTNLFGEYLFDELKFNHFGKASLIGFFFIANSL